MYLGMKRARDDVEIDSITMANCLLLLSRERQAFDSVMTTQYSSSSDDHRVYECKTCNKKFQSFQALGGHRASHKKPRLSGNNGEVVLSGQAGVLERDQTWMKQKTRHECSICGVEFALGQALGGHMRRHRLINANVKDCTKTAFTVKNLLSPDKKRGGLVAKKSNGTDRFLCLDLNLTPTENDIRSFDFMKFG